MRTVCLYDIGMHIRVAFYALMRQLRLELLTHAENCLELIELYRLTTV